MNHSWLRYWFCLTAAIFRKRQSRIASAPIKIRELIYQCIYKPPTNRFPSTNFLVYLLLICSICSPDQQRCHLREWCSCNQHAGSSGLLDSLLGGLREQLGLDNYWHLWHNSLSEDLDETVLGHIDHWGSLSFGLGSIQSGLLVNQSPELVAVHNWSPFPVSLQVEHSNTFLSEVTLMAV